MAEGDQDEWSFKQRPAQETEIDMGTVATTTVIVTTIKPIIDPVICYTVPPCLYKVERRSIGIMILLSGRRLFEKSM
jgi:hypothetical protein